MNNNDKNKGPRNVTIIYDVPHNETEKIVGKEVLGADTAEKKVVLPPWQEAALFGVVALLFGFGGAFSWLSGGDDVSRADEEAEIAETPKNPFDDIFLEAKSALAFDIAKGETLYAKNAEAQLPLASLAKLMTALIAEESLPSGEPVVLSKEAISEEGDNGLLVNEHWRKDDLIGLMLLASSNDGAHALASAVEAFRMREAEENATTTTPQLVPFSEMMNKRAQELGLSQTYFLNAEGLDMYGREGGASGSARNIAALLAYILQNAPHIFDATQYLERSFISLGGVTHILRNTNDRAAVIPGLVASKTGFTDLAGGNLAIIFEAGPMYPIAVVVLGSSMEGRFTDVETLISATLQKLSRER